MSKVGESGGDFGGGVVVSVIKSLLATGSGGDGKGVGDSPVGEDGEVHDGGGTEQVLLEGLPRALQQRLGFVYFFKKREG